MTLAHLNIGTRARITKIVGADYQPEHGGFAREELERRLLEAGFLEGETVEILHHGPIGRDPIAVQVGDMVIALRRNEAEAIFVIMEEQGSEQ